VKGLVLTYIVVCIGSLAALRYPLVGLNVFVGLAVLRPQAVFGFAGDLSGLSQLVGAATITGWAFQGFGSWKFGAARSVVLPLAWFLTWFVLSASLALDSARAYPFVIELAKLFVPFFVGLTLMKEEKDWRPTLWTMVLCMGYVGFEMNLAYLYKGYNTAATGFAGMDNNCFGVALVTVLGPAVALMVSSPKFWQRGLAALCAALILHTILLTFSRGAMLGLLAVGAGTFIIMRKTPRNLAALGLTVVVSLYFIGPQLFGRYASTFAEGTERDGSAQSRVELWEDCLEVANTYPFFGVGPANWRVIASRYGWSEGKSAHSVWMETAAEMGYPGALSLLAFFGIAILKLWPIARSTFTQENSYHVILASGVVLSIIGFCVSGQFVSVPGLEAPYYLVMLGAVLLKHYKPATTRAQIAVPATRPLNPVRAVTLTRVPGRTGSVNA
jgi:putative inorganic carbon (HCO3(-)) transporter